MLVHGLMVVNATGGEDDVERKIVGFNATQPPSDMASLNPNSGYPGRYTRHKRLCIKPRFPKPPEDYSNYWFGMYLDQLFLFFVYTLRLLGF